MSIWTYTDYLPGSVSLVGYRSPECPYCATALRDIGSIEHKGLAHIAIQGFACSACGFWKLEAERETEVVSFVPESAGWSAEKRYAHATLRNFSVRDWSAPLADLERYLMVRRDALGDAPPRLVEEAVGDAFRNLGYQVAVTAYSKDGGIDLFITEPVDGEVAAVQVKRYRSRVGVEHVRSLVGATRFAGVTKSVFVATSGFTRDATALARSDLVQIELLDGNWLLETLRVTLRPAYHSIYDEQAPYFKLTRDFDRLPLLVAPW